MDGQQAANFWVENKEFIQTVIEEYPATETKHEESESNNAEAA
tara:strand:+ start:6232 stop:6360 length:129 start_codon:yes stop_codon:yes gene_type:complete